MYGTTRDGRIASRIWCIPDRWLQYTKGNVLCTAIDYTLDTMRLSANGLQNQSAVYRVGWKRISTKSAIYRKRVNIFAYPLRNYLRSFVKFFVLTVLVITGKDISNPVTAVNRSDQIKCTEDEEILERWRENYDQALNRPPTRCYVSGVWCSVLIVYSSAVQPFRSHGHF